MSMIDKAMELVKSGMSVPEAVKKSGLKSPTSVYKKLRKAKAKRNGGWPKGKKRGKKVVVFKKTCTSGDNAINVSWKAEAFEAEQTLAEQRRRIDELSIENATLKGVIQRALERR